MDRESNRRTSSMPQWPVLLVHALAVVALFGTTTVQAQGIIGQPTAVNQQIDATHRAQHAAATQRGIAPAINTFHAPPHSASGQGVANNPVRTAGSGPFSPGSFGFNLSQEAQLGIQFGAARQPIRQPARSNSLPSVSAQSIGNDAFVSSEIAAENWAPGGKNFPGSFSDRGTVVAQGGSVAVTPVSTQQVGNFSLQTARIGGRYQYVNDLDSDHPIDVHAPFDITANATGTADNTTDTSEVRVNLQWVGTYSHPEDAYDGGPAGTGAVDIFTFEIEGNAAAQYFTPGGGGGSNTQPGLPNLPSLSPLPQFNDQPVPAELSGNGDPYGGPGYYYNNNSGGPNPYNPYNPQRYVDQGYNPYNPNPGFNPYQSIYQPTGAPDTSAYLAIAGGPASEVNNQSQFDISWMTEIQNEQGVQNYLDYGSFSSPESAVYRGIVRPVQLTSSNPEALAAWIQANGRLPSTIGTPVQIANGDPTGYNSGTGLSGYSENGFSSYEDYQQRLEARNNPSQQPAPQPGSNNRQPPQTLASYTANNRSSTIQGDNTPQGYYSQPSFMGVTGQSNSETFEGYYNNSGAGNAGYLNGEDIRNLGGTGIAGLDDNGRQAWLDRQAAGRKTPEQVRAEIAAIEDREAKAAAEEKAEEQIAELAKNTIELAKYEAPTPRVINTTTREATDEEINEALTNTALKQDPDFFKDPESTTDTSEPRDVEVAKIDVDADFERRFGKVENGGYEFDDPYAAGSITQDAELTPNQARDKAYGDTISENGWEAYANLPASRWDEIPEDIRTNETFVRIKIYEHVMVNGGKLNDAELASYVRGVTGNPAGPKEQSLIKDAIDWGGKIVSDPTSYIATGNTLVEIKDETVETFTGIWNLGVDFVNSSAQNKRIAAEAYVEAVLQTGVDVMTGKPIALLGEATGVASVKLEEYMTPEAREALVEDFMANPDKYFQVPVKVSVAFLVEELTTGGTGRIVNSTVKSVVTKLDDIKFNYKLRNSEQISLADISKTDLAAGEILVGKGGFGTVYFRGEKGKLYKVMREPDQAKALYNAKRQYNGYTDLKDAGIPVAEIHGKPKIVDGKVVIEVDDLEGPEWGASSGKFATIRETRISSLSPAEREAYDELIRDIDSKGMVWGDAKPDNAFFFRENGELKAGVLDHDLIMTKEQYQQWGPGKFENLTPKQRNDRALIELNGYNNLKRADFSDGVVREAIEVFEQKGLQFGEITPNEVYLEATRIQQLRNDAGL